MVKLAPPPMKKKAEVTAVLHKPVSGDSFTRGRVLDRHKVAVQSVYKRVTEDVAKVRVKDGKLLGSKPPVAPSHSKRQVTTNEMDGKCYCGCGRSVNPKSLFVRGHVKRLYAAIEAIERGELTPDEALTPSLVSILGPWVPYGPGHTPTNSLWDNK